MKYTVEYLPDKQIVEIKLSGRLNFQVAEKFSKEALKLARKNNCIKFLFDHSETIMQGKITRLHATGDELQQFGFKNTDHIAILIGNLENFSNFIEPNSQNGNWSTIKYFPTQNIQEANDWLFQSNQ